MLTKYNNRLHINTIVAIFLGIFLIGFLADISILRDVGISISVFLFIYILFFHKENTLLNIKGFLTSSKWVFITFLLLISSMTFSSIFAYYDSHTSLHYLFKALLNISLFAIIVASLSQEKIIFDIIKYAVITAFIIISFKFLVLIPILDAKIERTYSNYFELLFPFIFAMAIFSKQQGFYGLLSAISIVMVLFTGARGAYGAGIGEILIILAFYIYIKRPSLRKIYGMFTFIFLSLIILISTLYIKTDFIKGRIDIGFNPSSRDIIIKERLPIFMRNSNLFVGIGYGGDQYHAFLKDNNAPTTLAYYDKNKKLTFLHEEPYFLSFFYHFGIIGLILLLVFCFLFIKNILYHLIKYKFYDYNIMLIAIFASFVGKFLIRGLFEHLRFEHLLFLVILSIVYLPKEKVKP